MNPFRKYMDPSVRTQAAFDNFLRSFPFGSKRGAFIELGCDNYVFEETISVPSYIRIEGSGAGGAWDRGSTIKTTNPNIPAFLFSSTQNNALRHISFKDCQGVAFLQTGDRPCHDVALDRCTFYNCGRALLLEGTWQARMNDVECIECGTPDSPQIVLANSETTRISEAMIDSLRCEPMRGVGIWSDTRKGDGSVGMPVQVACYGAMEFEGHHADASRRYPAIVGDFYEGRFQGIQCRQSRSHFVSLGERSRRCVVEGTFISCDATALNLQGHGHVIGSATIIYDENRTR